MQTFSALLAICAGNSPVPVEFPTQRPVTQSFDVFFDLRPNKWLSKQWWSWWFETLSWPLWRHCNGFGYRWHPTGNQPLMRQTAVLTQQNTKRKSVGSISDWGQSLFICYFGYCGYRHWLFIIMLWRNYPQSVLKNPCQIDVANLYQIWIHDYSCSSIRKSIVSGVRYMPKSCLTLLHFELPYIGKTLPPHADNAKIMFPVRTIYWSYFTALRYTKRI